MATMDALAIELSQLHIDEFENGVNGSPTIRVIICQYIFLIYISLRTES